MSLTKQATDLIKQMIAQGWQVKFHADQMMPNGEWEFAKVERTENGEF